METNPRRLMTAGHSNYRIKGFDGLRALAVIMVWLEHKTSLNGSGIGGSGVELFFVLSGFLIIDILRRQRERIENGESTFIKEWKSFVSRRAYRIFPVYYIYMMAVAIPYAIFSHDKNFGLTAIIMNLTYLSNFWIIFIYQHWNSTTTHLWSLAVEEQFYILFPIFALIIPSKKIPVFCLSIVLLGIVVYAYLIVFRPMMFAIESFSLVAFGKIALGGLFVLLAANRSPLQGRASVLPAVLLVVFTAAPVLIHKYGSPYAAYVIQWVPLTLLIGTALVIIQKNQSSLFVAALELMPLRALGAVSYGFYVYHYLFGLSFIGKIIHVDFSLYFSKSAIHIFDFIIPLIISILSWQYIEKPILKRRPSTHEGPHELPSSTVLPTNEKLSGVTLESLQRPPLGERQSTSTSI